MDKWSFTVDTGLKFLSRNSKVFIRCEHNLRYQKCINYIKVLGLNYSRYIG